MNQILLTVAALTLGGLNEQLAQAASDCQRDVTACPLRDKLQGLQQAADSAVADAEEAKRELESQRLEQDALKEQKKATARANMLHQACGADYMAPHVGESWKRAQKCAGPFRVRAADPSGSVYESGGGWLRVQNGVVVKVVYK